MTSSSSPLFNIPAVLKNQGNDCFATSLFAVMVHDPFYKNIILNQSPSSLIYWKKSINAYDLNNSHLIESSRLRNCVLNVNYIATQECAGEFLQKLLDQIPNGSLSPFCRKHFPQHDKLLDGLRSFKQICQKQDCLGKRAQTIDAGLFFSVSTFKNVQLNEVIDDANPENYSKILYENDYPHLITKNQKENMIILKFGKDETKLQSINFNTLLHQNLETFESKEELLKAVDNKNQVRNCSVNVQISKITSQPPQNLIVWVQRLYYFNHGKKCNTLIEMDFMVDFKKAFFYAEENEKIYYSLNAVIIHKGSFSGGHYVALVKNQQNQWYLFDDMNYSKLAQKLNDKDAMELVQKGYLYFFQLTS